MEKANANAAHTLLTPMQAEKFPHFFQMLKDLFDKSLTADFASRAKAEEKQELLKAYTKARNEYESSKLIYDSLWDIVAESASEGKVCEDLETSLISSELSVSMKLVNPEGGRQEDEGLVLFGVAVEKVALENDAQRWASDKLKGKLVSRGVQLLQQHGHDVNGDSQELLMAKLSQLPSLLDSQLEEHRQLERGRERNKQMLREQHTKYVTTLLESLKILKDIMEKHILGIQMEQYHTNSQWIKVQCDALLLKIKSLHLEILCETYTKETVPALKKISKDLESRAHQTEADVEVSRARISRYESVGQDFNNIVNEYSQLRELIKQKKWTLEKLKSYRQPT